VLEQALDNSKERVISSLILLGGSEQGGKGEVSFVEGESEIKGTQQLYTIVFSSSESLIVQ
jgi:hypothetical protein